MGLTAGLWMHMAAVSGVNAVAPPHLVTVALQAAGVLSTPGAIPYIDQGMCGGGGRKTMPRTTWMTMLGWTALTLLTLVTIAVLWIIALPGNQGPHELRPRPPSVVPSLPRDLPP